MVVTIVVSIIKLNFNLYKLKLLNFHGNHTLAGVDFGTY